MGRQGVEEGLLSLVNVSSARPQACICIAVDWYVYVWVYMWGAEGGVEWSVWYDLQAINTVVLIEDIEHIPREFWTAFSSG